MVMITRHNASNATINAGNRYAQLLINKYKENGDGEFRQRVTGTDFVAAMATCTSEKKPRKDRE